MKNNLSRLKSTLDQMKEVGTNQKKEQTVKLLALSRVIRTVNLRTRWVLSRFVRKVVSLLMRSVLSISILMRSGIIRINMPAALLKSISTNLHRMVVYATLA